MTDNIRDSTWRAAMTDISGLMMDLGAGLIDKFRDATDIPAPQADLGSA